jgi:uncharacterized membrane protein YeaQ/YmgE (transglycosylase-associated protein family)
MSGLVLWLVIWVVVGLLVGALASIVVKDEPPYGLAVDIIASVVTMVVVGLADFYIMPLIGIEGALGFAIMILEPLAGVVLVLWLLRVVKRRRGG